MKDLREYELFVLERGVIQCADVEELFGELVEGDLISGLAERIEDHIEGCPHCQQFQKSYLQVVDLAAEIEDLPTPIEVQNRLRTALNERLGLNLPPVIG